jgi:hypothetical protein
LRVDFSIKRRKGRALKKEKQNAIGMLKKMKLKTILTPMGNKMAIVMSAVLRTVAAHSSDTGHAFIQLQRTALCLSTVIIDIVYLLAVSSGEKCCCFFFFLVFLRR